MESDDLRDVDWEIIDMLREGRNNAPNIAAETGYSTQYIRERFQTLKVGGIIDAVGHGIYELNPDEVPERN